MDPVELHRLADESRAQVAQMRKDRADSYIARWIEQGKMTADSAPLARAILTTRPLAPTPDSIHLAHFVSVDNRRTGTTDKMHIADAFVYFMERLDAQPNTPDALAARFSADDRRLIAAFGMNPERVAAQMTDSDWERLKARRRATAQREARFGKVVLDLAQRFGISRETMAKYAYR